MFSWSGLPCVRSLMGREPHPLMFAYMVSCFPICLTACQPPSILMCLLHDIAPLGLYSHPELYAHPCVLAAINKQTCISHVCAFLPASPCSL